MKRVFSAAMEPGSMLAGGFVGAVAGGVLGVREMNDPSPYCREPMLEAIGGRIMFGACLGFGWTISVPLGAIYFTCTLFVKKPKDRQ